MIKVFKLHLAQMDKIYYWNSSRLHKEIFTMENL